MVSFQELSKLKGIMRQYNIVYQDVATATDRSTSGICKILNGENDIKLDLQKKILNYVNEKSGQKFSLNDIFG